MIEVSAPEGCDARLIRRAMMADERGAFGRTWCATDFEQAGIVFAPVQANLSITALRVPIRAMHFQRPPFAEAKLVRCTRGAIWDVVTDLRPDSPSLGRSFAFELSEAEPTSLFIPEGFAHGFQTLTDDTHVEYLMGQVYSGDHADGFRYDDPAAGIEWPAPVSCVTPKDLAWPDLAPRLHTVGVEQPG